MTMIEISREQPRQGKSPLGVKDILLPTLFFCALIAANYLNLLEAKKTLGWALSYAMFAIAPYLIIAAIERLATPAGPRKSSKQWVLHFQIMLIYILAGIPMGIFGYWLAGALVNHLGFQLGLIDLRVPNEANILMVVGAFLLFAFIADFFFYWVHRMQHKIPFLWQHHKLHHMDSEFDVLTGARQDWVQAFVAAFFIAIPTVILLKANDQFDLFTSGFANGIAFGIWTFLAYQNHSNLRVQFGKASVILTSSQSHRIHHSCLPQHRDKNFVAFFPIWDILFGTYYHPARNEFPPTGVEGEKEIGSVWEVQIFAFREWYKMLHSKWKKSDDF